MLGAGALQVAWRPEATRNKKLLFIVTVCNSGISGIAIVIVTCGIYDLFQPDHFPTRSPYTWSCARCLTRFFVSTSEPPSPPPCYGRRRCTTSNDAFGTCCLGCTRRRGCQRGRHRRSWACRPGRLSRCCNGRPADGRRQVRLISPSVSAARALCIGIFWGMNHLIPQIPQSQCLSSSPNCVITLGISCGERRGLGLIEGAWRPAANSMPKMARPLNQESQDGVVWLVPSFGAMDVTFGAPNSYLHEARTPSSVTAGSAFRVHRRSSKLVGDFLLVAVHLLGPGPGRWESWCGGNPGSHFTSVCSCVLGAVMDVFEFTLDMWPVLLNLGDMVIFLQLPNLGSRSFLFAAFLANRTCCFPGPLVNRTMCEPRTAALLWCVADFGVALCVPGGADFVGNAAHCVLFCECALCVLLHTCPLMVCVCSLSLSLVWSQCAHACQNIYWRKTHKNISHTVSQWKLVKPDLNMPRMSY